jgi:phosphorylase kinase gamma subunit
MEIVKILGKGATSEVKLVKDIDIYYAVKYIKIKDTHDLKNIEDEIKILRKLSNIDYSYKYISRYIWSKIHESHIAEIAIEYIDGPHLKKYIDTYDLVNIKEIMHQLLIGLQFIHNNGFVHRDIKLENILYDKGNFKYIDFGFSCNIDDKQCLSIIKGTPYFLSPEYDIKNNNISLIRKKSDIWSLGICLFYCYYKYRAFDATTKINLVDKIKNEDLDELEDVYKDEQIKIILKLMLTKDYKKRYDIDQLIEIFEKLFIPNFTVDELIDLGASRSDNIWSMFNQVSYIIYRSDIRKDKIIYKE